MTLCTRSISRTLAAALAALLLTLSLLARSARAEELPAQARELYKAGVAAYDSGDYAKAAEHFRECYELVSHPDTLFNLAKAELKLGEEVLAARHLRELLTLHRTAATPDMRSFAERQLGELERKLGRLQIVVTPEDAVVLVDGKEVGKSPLADPVYVEPGEHSVVAKKQGFREGSKSASVLKGALANVTLELSSDTQAMPGSGIGGTDGPADANGGVDTSSTNTRTIVLVTGAALTVVGLGVGIGFAIDAGSSRDKEKELGAEVENKLGPSGCSGSSDSLCAELADTVDHTDRSRMLSTVGFIGAGVFAAATVATYFLWQEDKPRESANGLKLHPLVGSTKGMALTGTF